MCHTSERHYKNCKNKATHRYYENVPCPTASGRNPFAMCPRVNVNPPHYNVVGPMLKTTTSINCPTCNNTEITLVSFM